MYESFELPVTYKEQELSFPAQLIQQGYVHNFRVTVKGQEIVFERDEEMNYRAIIDAEKMNKEIDIQLLKLIAETLKEITS